MEAIHIIQHNINTWNNKRYELYNTYRHLTPDIILLNDIGNTTSPIRLQGFNVYQRKSNNNVHGGTAIAIRRSIPHTIEDKFITDLIAVTIDTRQGPITIATDYIPPVVQTRVFRPGPGPRALRAGPGSGLQNLYIASGRAGPQLHGPGPGRACKFHVWHRAGPGRA